MSSSSLEEVGSRHGDQNVDLERQKTTSPVKLSKLAMVYDQSAINVEVSHYPYRGNGTSEDPYIVEWIPNDPRNPMVWPSWYKWFIALTNAISTLSIAFVSSGYAGGLEQIMEDLGMSQEVATLGLSLFVLGFAIGPLFWAPLSEVYGRQILFTLTYCAVTAFNAGAAGAHNVATLLVMRFFAGAFGSSPLTNAGGVIADMFDADDRGKAMTFFAVAPFMGPVLGPIVGGFVGVTSGWRWVEGVMAIFTGLLWIFQSLTVPETYGPVLLRGRADRLTEKTGKNYVSVLDKARGRPRLSHSLRLALSRPWSLLFREPIVLMITIYMAIIYGTLYLMFGAFPIVFQVGRGWPQQIANLAFIPVTFGIIVGAAYNFWDNGRYRRINAQHNGNAPPESRLPPAILGSVLLPIGLFWFAWSSQPSVHWIVPMFGVGIFGCSVILIFLASMNYLIDSYVIFAASALAANSVLRSLFGAAFPLFTVQMYTALGVNWASSLLAFLGVACMPFPLLFYKYGAPIRLRCKYAAKAHKAMEEIRRSQQETAHLEGVVEAEKESQSERESGRDSQREGEGEGERERGRERKSESESQKEQKSKQEEGGNDPEKTAA